MGAAAGWRSGLAIFTLSLGVYLFALSLFPAEVVLPTMEWEATSVAITLAERGEFGDPYALRTGSTAHLPPIPPAITALVYRVVGVNATGGYVAWAVVGVAWAALWGLLPWVARRLGLPSRAGVIAGVVSGVIPSWPGHGEDLAALALALILVGFVARWTARAPVTWTAFVLGVGCGAAFHVQPALLTVVLGCLAFELAWGRSRAACQACGAVVLGIAVACAPWTWRNYRTFDALFFVRSNFGLELRMGNHPGARPSMEVMDRLSPHRHPRALESEARKVQALGEAAYMRAAGREALDWMRANPGEAVRLGGWRVAHWWFGPFDQPSMAVLTTLVTCVALIGLMLWWPQLTVPARAALVIPLLTFPIVYYLVAYMPRYRQPVDWIYYLLAAAAVSRALAWVRQRA